ncbi:MAG: aminotransferase class I/II-fold pyridoxal phosphate-dependent enzyme [Rhodobacteraceae bacterium]|nr:aminotransferase class I/II-fold pyridoxal phosphate-dependent enzyme [Paracoccaceae bacterium]
MTALSYRNWVPEHCETYIQSIAAEVAETDDVAIEARLNRLIDDNRRIHDMDCINLNPAANVLNPKAEAVLAQSLGSRPSLGYPGDKYEMGLEAIEQIEVIAAELVAEVFAARFAEIRVASGALANLYAFMATTKPGDAIIVPPPTIGGHVTHHPSGCAGLYGVAIHSAPINPDGYTIDLEGLAQMAEEIRPKLITIGGSLNLFEHPVVEIRKIADRTGAKILFDAAHQCGLIAGGVWRNPLAAGADLMTMSTYKSLGGPAGGVIVTNDPALAEKLDHIAFPGLTANFDAAKSASLAITMLDWLTLGKDYAAEMVAAAHSLATSLEMEGVPVFSTPSGFTKSHQFAVEAAQYGGGQQVSKQLREANILACGIGLPISPVTGDLNGLRLGTPEIVRRGMRSSDMADLARLIAKALRAEDPTTVRNEVTEYRKSFTGLHFIR